MPSITKLELIGTDSGKLGISQEEGGADVTYLLSGADENTAPTPAQLSEFVDYVCGGVANIEPKVVNTGTEGAGKIIRVLPPVHPLRPELSAAGLIELVPATEQHEPATAVAVYGLDPITPLWPNATTWKAKVRFVKRPYFLLPDEKIGIVRKTYFPPDGSSGIPVYVAEEHRRFTSITRVPTGETISASFGSNVYQTASGAVPQNNNYTGQPFVSAQNSNVELTWYNVPLRYTQDFDGHRSYLARFVNTINQTDFIGCEPGSLLYQGYSILNQYIPVTPKRQKLLGALSVGLDQGLLCNLKLRFLHTAREGTDVPDPATSPLLANKNRIAAGHNLVPLFSQPNQFYYVTSQPASGLAADKKPLFDSFEFGLFMTDPCLQQIGGAI